VAVIKLFRLVTNAPGLGKLMSLSKPGQAFLDSALLSNITVGWKGLQGQTR